MARECSNTLTWARRQTISIIFREVDNVALALVGLVIAVELEIAAA